MADADEATRSHTRSNWATLWYGALLVASLSAMAFHAGAIAWGGVLASCTTTIDAAMIVSLAIAVLGLFMEVRWLNTLVIVLCGVAVTMFVLIIGFSEALCVRRISAGVPWPTVVVLIIHIIRAMSALRRHE